MFKTKYRIVHKWTIRKPVDVCVNNIPDKTVENYYVVEYKNILTTLFGSDDVWDTVTIERFSNIKDARDYLENYIKEHHSKELDEHFSEVEYATRGYYKHS